MILLRTHFQESSWNWCNCWNSQWSLFKIRMKWHQNSFEQLFAFERTSSNYRMGSFLTKIYLIMIAFYFSTSKIVHVFLWIENVKDSQEEKKLVICFDEKWVVFFVVSKYTNLQHQQKWPLMHHKLACNVRTCNDFSVFFS